MRLGESKRALRRIAQRWLPRAILERPKQGFVLPMRTWLQAWFERRGGARAYFAAAALPDLDTQVLIELVESDLAAGLQRERLWYALILLAEWRATAYRRMRAQREALAAGSPLPA